MIAGFRPFPGGRRSLLYFYNTLNLLIYFDSRRKTTRWTDPHRSMAQGLLSHHLILVRVAFLSAHAVLARSAMRVVPFFFSTPQ
jgi:hypothetical protein